MLQNGGKDPTRLTMGDSQDPTGITSGTYNMSGGTLTHTVGSTTSSEGSIVIGDRGGTGTFKVIGTAPVINMGRLYVGGNSGSTGARGSNGTLAFELTSGSDYDVSRIRISNSDVPSNARVTLDPYGAASTAALVVTVASAVGKPAPIIELVQNTGTAAVVGVFDTLNGGSAAERRWVTLNLFYHYMLTYKYDIEGGKYWGGNDIVLIPEPATIALLSLGLFAIRRKK